MLKRIIIGIVVQYSYFIIIFWFCFLLYLLIIDYFLISKSMERNTSQQVYNKLIKNNFKHINTERISIIKISYQICFYILIYVLIYLYFYFRLKTLINNEKNSWAKFIFDVINKKKIVKLNYDSSVYNIYTKIILFLFFNCIIINKTVLVILCLFINQLESLNFTTLYYIKKYKINLLTILLFLLVTEILNLFIFYFYFYSCYLFRIKKNFLSGSNQKLCELKFDCIIHINSKNGISIGNGPILHKQIIIFRGNLDNLSEKEVCGIILHEIGHGGNLGVHFSFLISLNLKLFFTVLFYLISIQYVKEFFIFDEILVLNIFLFLIPIVFMCHRVASNIINFYIEFKADCYAIENGYGEYLINALYKVYLENLIPTKINYLTNLMTSSHPCLYYRCLNYEKNKYVHL